MAAATLRGGGGMMRDKKCDPANLYKKKEKRLALPRVEGWVHARLPARVKVLLDRGVLRIGIRETYCDDPACAPVDTVIEFAFNGSICGEVGLPYEVDQLCEGDFGDDSLMPPEAVLLDWSSGKKTAWPIAGDTEAQPALMRFAELTRVECCVGRDEWLAGSVVKLWYREPGFPKGFYAPYQVHLDDGRLIFAPEDSERCIRAQQQPV